jgi:hypothetical protein
MNDHIDDDRVDRLDDGQEDLFDIDESEEFGEIDKAYRREELQWLADRGLCSWSEAVEYFAGPFVPQPEYERITRNYVDEGPGARFTVCRPDERPLLEIWKCGHGPNSSQGWAVVHAKKDRSENGEPHVGVSVYVDETHYLVRVGPPQGYQFHRPGAVSYEALIERWAIDRLLEPLKSISIPVMPGEDKGMCILDGATRGFEIQLGYTRFSYEWHTIAPAGWEPIAEWLHATNRELERLLRNACS